LRERADSKICVIVRLLGGEAMRILNTKDLAAYVRRRRRELGMTQADLTVAARVSARWLADFEAGKPTVEFGRVLRALDALGIAVDVRPEEPSEPDDRIDLDVLLDEFREGPR
jgi:HTH-type transcriptional regulator / antitoxin HipB